jgi:hypothetical protein
MYPPRLDAWPSASLKEVAVLHAVKVCTNACQWRCDGKCAYTQRRAVRARAPCPQHRPTPVWHVQLSGACLPNGASRSRVAASHVFNHPGQRHRVMCTGTETQQTYTPNFKQLHIFLAHGAPPTTLHRQQSNRSVPAPICTHINAIIEQIHSV